MRARAKEREGGRGGQRERQGETDRQRERHTDRERESQGLSNARKDPLPSEEGTT